MAVEEWYQRLREESRQFMEENQRQWDERQREWDRRRIADERQQIESQIADQERDRRRIADQEWQLRMQDSDRRFYKSLNEIRVQFGMAPVDYSCEAMAEENREEETNVEATTPEVIGASKPQIKEDLVPSDNDGTRGSGSGLLGRSEERSSFNQTTTLDFPTNLEESLGSDNHNHQRTHLTNLSARNSQAPSNDGEASLGIEGVTDPTIFWGINIVSKCRTLFKDFRIELDLGAPNQKLLVESNGVISNPLDVTVAVESDRMDELALPEFAMVKRADSIMISVEFLGNSVAHKLLVEMPLRDIMINGSPSQSGNTPSCKFPIIFDPGGNFEVKDWEVNECKVVSRVLSKQFGLHSIDGVILFCQFIQVCSNLMPFDRGRVGFEEAGPRAVHGVKRALTVPFVFDPGGIVTDALSILKYIKDHLIWVPLATSVGDVQGAAV